MRVALLHDHLISDGGGERVLEAFTQLYPEAPIYTFVYDPDKAPSFTRGKDIRTSFLQRLPLSVAKYRWYLPLLAIATERLDLSDFDLVLSNSSAHAKGAPVPPGTMHINYCNTPTRYLWVDKLRLDPLERVWPVSWASDYYKERLKRWDMQAATRPHQIIANSRHIQRLVKKFYNRAAPVIYPPVNVERFSLPLVRGEKKTSPLASGAGGQASLVRRGKGYYLTGGRLVAHKRFDIAVRAFTKIKIPLKVFGVGPELPRLQALAGPNIKFLGRQPDEKLSKLYACALAFIYSQEEDFGITAVESQAAGRPVIAYRAGGALETVKEGETGEFIDDQDWQALADKVIRFDPTAYDPDSIRQHAAQFSAERFKQGIKKFVDREYEAFKLGLLEQIS